MIAYILDILWTTFIGMIPTILFFIAVIYVGKREQGKARNRRLIPITNGKPDRE